MRQIFVTAHGGADVLKLREAADPEPNAGEMRIRVQACGVNFADILARQGLYPGSPRPPYVIGMEVSGAVDAVGAGVGAEWIGREVFAMSRVNGYADTIIVSAHHVFAKPAALTHIQAAALPLNYLTAWQLLVVMGALSADETVLIQNAGGGVGLAAIDIASHIGATIYGTASAGKHDFLRTRGLHEVIDYTRTDWAVELDRITGGRGVELIIDPLGGANLKKSYKALRSSGRLGMFGMSTATESKLIGTLRFLPILFNMPIYTPFGLMGENRGVFGVNLASMWEEFDKVRGWMHALLQGVEDGWVRPHIDKTFPLANASDAHAHIEARRNIGKVVLTA